MESKKDQLQVKNSITQVQLTDFTASTKRKVLATTASIFDPLGLLSQAGIAYKIFLQKLWQDKLQWNEYFMFMYNKNGIVCNRPFPNYHTLGSFVPMLLTYNSMDSATAVNEPMEPVCTFAPQTTTTTDFHVNFCASLQRWHH